MQRRMRNALLVCAVAVGMGFCAGNAAALQFSGGMGPGQMRRGRHGRMMSPEHRLQMLTKQLQLTSDEQAKIKPILENEQKQMQDLRSNPPDSRQEMFEKMQQIHQDSSKQIRATLDEKQQKKFDKMEKERRERMEEMRQRRGMGRGGPGPGFPD